MRAIRAIGAEIVSLFVDDGSLALALVLWCAAVGLARFILPQMFLAAAGAALFLGCAAILLVNVLQTARSRVASKVPQ
ncbi:hypothetical protein ACFQY5_17970 [Paeniroseomonas aquatica]|uniref:Uncharacterized protein n=1 Tax=Paeniroseomonas aquatica TaxID=373043 RepID=A0ABT8A4A7_9PROT|nr:hypothetical protein [Paeniroseomonas aquatica]MDN3564627.1 hypothetical protein [Paeniroseomonas aquatica]